MTYADHMPDHVAKLARTDIGLAQALAVGVVRLNRRLRQERRSDLTPNQAAVLGALRRLGSMTPGALAEAERVRPPTMTRIVNSLAEIGYVTRSPHPSDGRQVVVSISDDGALTGVRLAQSSGHTELDQQAVQIVSKTAFPVPPSGMKRVS